MDTARQAVPLVLDLVRRLTEDYSQLAPALVVRCVEAASGGMRYAGADLTAVLALVEELARADLDQLAAQALPPVAV